MKKIILIVFFTQCIQLLHTAQCSLTQQRIWYIGNKIGFPQYHNIVTCINKLIIYTNTYDLVEHSSLGFGTLIGYQNNQYFAFELEHNWLGKITFYNNDINSTFKIQNTNLCAKIHYSIMNKTNLYTKCGGAIWNVKIKNTYCNNKNIYNSHITDTGLSPVLSFGIEHEFKKNWKTRLEYQRINNIGNINTVGAQSNHTIINLNILHFFIIT